MKEENVLFIVRTMGLGGTENVVLQLCEILSEKVNKIVVCSSGGVHEKKLQEMGIKHYVIPDIASKNPMDMLKSCRSIKNVIDKEQISIVHSHHRMAAFYAELVAPRSVVKVANAHNKFTDKKRRFVLSIMRLSHLMVTLYQLKHYVKNTQKGMC